ncbi:hypothetical protein DPQ33_17020 [Oceanidesulfovibrio indonesiensis]|uniref:Uncharacterized protein n=1 Tax=Oceanidesulfovibrio indonesiensis TaxID=54767 RepID=A0A7M3MAL1_9BACT|nr:hypothetical protein [Oceanidesulfovibrio indonesiensis]TVM14708.1 hypothetical protein DPQ33_17020 [Oceanidesulfovibrio indonesiensis]
MNASPSPSKGKLRRHIGVLAGSLVLLTILVPFLALTIFNGHIYPSYGIEQFSEDEYREAILQAADLFADSIGYEADEILTSTFRSLDPQPGKFCWGVVRAKGLGENTGTEQRIWISLKKYGDSWMRSDTNIFPETNSVQLMVDPDDQLFFQPLTIPNFVKLKMEAGRLWREQLRRLHEVYGF